ncbi:MAG: hypothetical protein Q8S33_22015 [Myxococcales bacterium]|nr:hypothetical protein [Myxococcales bacterium]
MRRLLVVAVVSSVFFASPAFADSPTDGVGRVSFGGGLRWTPNGFFNVKATEAGRPTTSSEEFVTAPLGFQGMASFGYGAFEWLELAVDVFGGFESFQLEGWLPFSSVSYGGLIGVRLTRYDFPFAGLVPYLGIQTGPMLVTVTSPSLPGAERIMQAWSVNGGAAWKFTERLGLYVDIRYLYGRAYVSEIAGRNVGGVWFSAGLTIFFPPTPRRDLDVPGFGGGSRF